MVDFCPDDTPQLQAWRGEVRAFLEEALPNGMRFDYDYDEDEERWAEYLAFWRKVGAKGWVALTWPKAYYGQDRSAIEKWILQEEFAAHDVPMYPVIGTAVSAAVLRHGTHEQRLRHLKGIAEVTVLWGEGYTEPGAGSDLASLTTRAHRDGDFWVLNGQKTLGTAAHHCQWMNVLARTDPDSKRHNGVSCFMVPLDTPGISMTPLHNMGGGRQNHTFFDNVRVPADCLLGDEGQAWSQIWFGQGGERLDNALPGPEPFSFRVQALMDDLLEYCRTTKRGGVPLSQDPVIRLQLAELMTGVELVKLQTFELFSNIKSRTRQADISQLYLKEFWPRQAQIAMEIVGPMAQVAGGRWARLEGRFQHFFLSSFGNHAGGTSQLKRMTFATRGLGLPR
jgi:alkylation response protein AidB-like acyl-CoA dehydrogenase